MVNTSTYLIDGHVTASGITTVSGIFADSLTVSGVSVDISGGGITAHSTLSGLTEGDDHTQYILADGTRAFSSTVSGISPTAEAHLATKAYVDSNNTPAPYSQDFTAVTSVNVTHGFNEISHSTTLVDASKRVLDADIVYGVNTDVATFIESQTGTAYVVGSRGNTQNALTGSDGITITSGTSTIDVAGFRTEFVSASGSLQTQIDSGIDHGSLVGLGDDDHPQYGQLADAESASGIWDFSTNLTVTGSNVVTLGGIDTTVTGNPGALSVGIATFSQPTGHDHTTLQGNIDIVQSAGHTQGSTITSGTSDNTIDVAIGEGYIRKDDSHESRLMAFEHPAVTELALTTTAINYVGVEFNSGNPQAVIRTTYNWNLHNEFPLGNVVSVSGILHIENAPQEIEDSTSLTLERLFRTQPRQRDILTGGLALAESADNNRNLSLSAGAVWDRLTQFIIGAVDTSASNTFDAFYFDGGDWITDFSRTTWPNTQFNDITSGLVTMTNNRYAVLWFYVKADGDLDMVYGTAQYTSEAAAEDEPEPSSPDVIVAQGLLVGRLIFQKSKTIAELVENAFETAFAGSLATDHGNLTGLADDDHLQYILEDGTRAFSGNQSFGSNDITSVGEITATSGSVTNTGGTELTYNSAEFSNSLTVSGVPVRTDAPGVGNLDNVVEDTSPQLGGNLDAQSNDITDVGTLASATGNY